MDSREIHLFEAVGIELEYMIVDDETLDVRPIADQLLADVGGGDDVEVERGPLAWSNELALHVIELKTNGPAAHLTPLSAQFQAGVADVEARLTPRGARLLPTGMHPWMDPHAELKLWPNEYNEVYRAFDRIFDCRGHGWANLQSMHINLPFWGDDELGRLHAAIRLVLPILPAIAASSPIVDGATAPALDHRLAVYRTNARRVPSVSGHVVPEAVFTRAEYEAEILERIYRDLAPHDPQGILRHEWANARGCIARFDRSALEIRVLDLQEAPIMDIAVAQMVIAVVQALVEERGASYAEQKAWSELRLAELLSGCIVDGEEAALPADYAAALGGARREASAGAVWRQLMADVWPSNQPEDLERARDVILEQGPLARRILRAVGDDLRRPALRAVYTEIAEGLRAGRAFVP